MSLDSSAYDAGLGAAQEKASSFGSKLGTAMEVGGAAIAAATTAATALAGAFVAGASNAAAYGDNIDKMSQKLGMSAEAYQEWDAIMQHSGTSIETMQAGMKTLANAVESGNSAFERLGMTQEQIANMSQEDLFAETITALQGVTNETERTYLAGQLLGRGATELGALLNTSAEDTEAMRRRVHELGGVMSDDAVKAAAKYQDSLQDMSTAFSGLKRNMTSEFLPAITTVMDGLTELFFGGDGLGQISEGIDQFVARISDVAPRMLEVGSNIILALSQAIIDNLPKLTETAVKVMLQLAQGLVEQLPQLVEAGLGVIVSLAQGIIDALPELIPTIVDVILQIVDVLTDPENLSALVDAAIAIILALAQGIIDAWPRLIEKAPEIIENLVTALVENAPKIAEAALELIVQLAVGLVENLPKLFESAAKIVWAIVEGIGRVLGNVFNIAAKIGEAIWDGIKGFIKSAYRWGVDLVQNFIDGILSMFKAVWDVIKGIGQGIKDFLGFSEPKKGPLSNFHTYAPDMMKLFAQGIRDNEHLVTDQIKKSFDFGEQTMDFTANVHGANVDGFGGAIGGSTGYGYGESGGEQTINLVVTVQTDDGTFLQRFAHKIRPYMQEEERLGGVALA